MSTEGAALSREEKKVENKDVRILVIDDEPTLADSLRQIKAAITWQFAICNYLTWMGWKSCVI